MELAKNLFHWCRIFPILVSGGGEGKFSPVGWGETDIFTGGGNFFTGWRNPEDKSFWRFEPFSKLEIAFCEYWMSIKIKINMTCVSEEYEIEQVQWSRSNTYSYKCCFYWVITWKLLFSGGLGGVGGGDTNLVGVIFLGWWEWANFGLVGGTPSYGKPCDVLFLGLHDPL